MAKSKISIVKYLNAVPLAWGILEGPQKEAFEPVLTTPAECADQLANGRVDIGKAAQAHYLVGGQARPCLRQIEPAITAEPGKRDLFEIEDGGCPAGADIAHGIAA